MISGKILSLSRLELPTLRLSGVYSNQLSYKLFFSKKLNSTAPPIYGYE